jgi:hypothetical protein
MWVRIANLFRQAPDLATVEMVDNDGNALAAQRRDEVGGVLDRLGAVVVRL